MAQKKINPRLDLMGKEVMQFSGAAEKPVSINIYFIRNAFF